MSIRLYLGNLPKDSIDREELQSVFSDYGDSVNIKVIKDRKTGKCRGFAFLTVPTDEMADELIEKHNGQSFKESPLKIEKALPRSKEKKEDSEVNSESTNAPSAPAKKRGKTPRRGGGSSSKSSSNNNSSGSVQPDPRWADELAKLKEMLATQGSNS